MRDYLEAQLGGAFRDVRGVGGPGYEHEAFEARLAWERRLGADGWTCLAWPKEHGGRGLTLMQQVIWHEEYARPGAPGRLGHIGETLVGPTIIGQGPSPHVEFLVALPLRGIDRDRDFLPASRRGTMQLNAEMTVIESGVAAAVARRTES